MMAAKAERWALLSVADKTGIIELAYALAGAGFKILSTGSTATALRQAEIEVLDLREIAGTSDALEGPAGLLHPNILSGILAERDNPAQMRELERRGGKPIDLVAVNFYPVSAVTGDANLTLPEVLAYIDVAGPTILRAAARNFRHVYGLCDPDDYPQMIDSFKQNWALPQDALQSFAAKAFHYSAYYDSTVAQYLGGKWDRLPDELVIALKKTAELHYGENPHQQGALYTFSGARPWGVNAAQVLYGKPLSYNFYLDLDTAWELAGEIEETACAIVKHGVPTAAAAHEVLADAVRLAYRSDPRGAFQATAAVNREIDEDAAAAFAEESIGVIAAPQFSQKALSILKVKKDIRLVTLPSTLVSAEEMDLKTLGGGLLVQEKDHQPFSGELKVAGRRPPTDLEMKSLRLAWHAAKHARTHAAVIVAGQRTVGVGSGQTSRLDAVRLALVKSQERHPILPAGVPLVLASDGVLSAEHIQEAAQGNVSAIIEPGGSSEDREAIEAANQKNIALVFTGIRHFRH